ncbi:hypothetical protein [Gordonia sp. NPDC003429]
MSKKYLLVTAGALAVLSAIATTVLILRRTRPEPPPISATVPRIEELSETPGTPETSTAR